MQKQLAQLEQVLSQQLTAHDRLITALRQKLQALRQADQQRVTSCTRLENEQVQSIGQLEESRLMLVAELTRIVVPNAPKPMRLLPLTDHIEEPARGRLLVLRQQLHEKMHQVQREASLARRVTETLVRHFQGLIQTVSSVAAGTGTYGRGGAPPGGALAISTFNTTA